MLINKWQLGRLREEDEEGSEGSSGKKGKKAKEKAEESEEESEESEEESEDEESEEDTDEDEDEEKDEDEDDEFDDAKLKEAKNLFRLITNPASQKQAIEILARSAGIQLGGGAPESKKEAKEIANDTVKILEEALGENLKWLAPKLATALDKLRDADREENKKSLASLKASQIEKEVDQAYAELRRETKGVSAKFENRMVTLADKLLPAAGMSVAEYVRHLYTIASATGESKSAKQRLAEKINKNSKDIPGRIRNSSSDGGGRKGTDSTPPMSALEAVTQTARKLGYKQ